jgi:beta-galactosidase
VDFDVSGPAVWRGGYNSGKTNSVNNPFLDLECGVNRVAIRSTATPGAISVAVHGGGLKPANTMIISQKFPVANGYALQAPRLPALPALSRPVFEPADTALAAGPKADAGRFLAAFSYSGPTTSVRVEQDAHDGARIYADRNFTFSGLPTALAGSDWVQTANADKLYSAVDLLDFSLKTDVMVYVAHDRRLPVPDWLQQQFAATGLTLLVNGQAMKVYSRRARNGESLTLGSNTEDPKLKACNMYLVFVKRDDGVLHASN